MWRTHSCVPCSHSCEQSWIRKNAVQGVHTSVTLQARLTMLKKALAGESKAPAHMPEWRRRFRLRASVQNDFSATSRVRALQAAAILGIVRAYPIAGVAELADARDSKSRGLHGHESSTLSSSTKLFSLTYRKLSVSSCNIVQVSSDSLCRHGHSPTRCRWRPALRWKAARVAISIVEKSP